MPEDRVQGGFEEGTSCVECSREMPSLHSAWATNNTILLAEKREEDSADEGDRLTGLKTCLVLLGLFLCGVFYCLYKSKFQSKLEEYEDMLVQKCYPDKGLPLVWSAYRLRKMFRQRMAKEETLRIQQMVTNSRLIKREIKVCLWLVAHSRNALIERITIMQGQQNMIPQNQLYYMFLDGKWKHYMPWKHEPDQADDEQFETAQIHGQSSTSTNSL
ncbi:hypothetical protein Ciccas_012063 [Cichlidogyrus casuarinus]|uniref:Uncharacterized protein n=1 Tax=Cichlidogyrus casuarinus TaxID=1844966 RepID=A0ABD2PPH3_9PLAT